MNVEWGAGLTASALFSILLISGGTKGYQMTPENIAEFVAYALSEPGNSSQLDLTSVHHHDDKPAITVETMAGEFFTIYVMKGALRP